MDTKENTSDTLPTSVFQILEMCVEEVREHLKAGQRATERQIMAARRLLPQDRDRVMPGLQAQLLHYTRSQGPLDYLLTRCKQRMKWIKSVRNLNPNDLCESAIDKDIWRVMQWPIESEPLTV